uniref:Uncharacterized protein n=1 Tax=Aegilops tauschii subsp. strangulata TaxID=200361 RepID=A0A453LDF7_AEGTS
MTIYSRALSITGIDDRRYWNFIPNDESRGSVRLLISRKSGGLKSEGRLSSASQKVHTACSSVFILAGLSSGSVAGFTVPSTSMGGT